MGELADTLRALVKLVMSFGAPLCELDRVSNPRYWRSELSLNVGRHVPIQCTSGYKMMEPRLPGYEISRPRPIERPVERRPSRHNESAPIETSIWPEASRPLSDIREITEPSLVDGPARRRSSALLQPKRSLSTARSIKQPGSVERKASTRLRQHPGSQKVHAPSRTYDAASSSSYSPSPNSSFCAIPQPTVPRRSSSQGRSRRLLAGHTCEPLLRAAPQAYAATHPAFTVPNRGQSRSPVKEAKLRVDPVTADEARRVPSRTLVRTPQPSDILEFPSYKHPRIRLDLEVSAPMFVGGGTVEGYVKLTVDDNERLKHRRSLGIGTIAVDLLGFEEVAGNRKAIFLALGTDLIDAEHPPPANMTVPANPLAPNDKFWTLKPSTSVLPFMISLPLDTGPPPFESRQASTRFLLCATALISDAGKHYRIRSCLNVHVLPTYDPEKALTSLPSPLTAADELQIPRAGGYECLKVTAGLHRQVWVSGGSIFVDVHIANKSRKLVRRLDLSVERDILRYKHAAAGTRDKSAGQARIFESNSQSMVAQTSLRVGANGWNGVEPLTSITRTFDIEVPRGHATVKCGKFFEVRFFLNVTVSLSNTKLVSVQLPIILIHMNSLDAVPNSVAQVAAAIEEKRAAHHRRRSSDMKRRHHLPFQQRSVSSPARDRDLTRRPSYAQGRAFAAPRQQSLDKQRGEKANLDDLCRTLDSSPRKHQPYFQGNAPKMICTKMSFGDLSTGGDSMTGDNPFRAMVHKTPTAKRQNPNYVASDEKPSQGLRERIRRMHSLDSSRDDGCGTTTRPKTAMSGQNARPTIKLVPSNQHLPAHALGLSTTVADRFAPTSRPTTSTGFWEQPARSRFEFKPVRRKGSGRSMKERGIYWWEQMVHRDKAREGWI